MNTLGYQSSSTYLALPDILKTWFHFKEQRLNVKQALAVDFHSFISQFVEEFEDVDTSAWPIHLRWRVINACLADGQLRLAEVPDGYMLEVPEAEALSSAETPEWTEESEQERVWSEVNQHLQEYGQALEDSSNRRMHAWAEKRQQQREQRK